MPILYTRVSGTEESKISDLISYPLFSFPMAKAKCVPVLGCGEVCPVLQCPGWKAGGICAPHPRTVLSLPPDSCRSIPICEFVT